MVSRRNFIAITMMMLVICFLFLLPQLMKETSNPYSQNSYAVSQNAAQESSIWKQPQILSAEDLEKEDAYILYIGDPSDRVGYAVNSWAAYNKKTMVFFGSVSEFDEFGGKLPQMAILDVDCCDFVKDIRTLHQWNKAGVTLVFNGLPSEERVSNSRLVRNLMGIREVAAEQVSLETIRVFGGFLLGGERIYGQETELDRQLMDLDLSAPWVLLQPGVKVYVMGVVSEEDLPEQDYRNEQLPPMIWRKSVNGSNVFVVNGDFLEGNAGIGFLSAIMAEDQPYYLYPIVNSQVLTIANFPGMANENYGETVARYGKSQAAMVRDLLWPSMESVAEVNDFRMSCFEMPQYDYMDAEEPDPELISYYLKLLRERNAEAGLSLQHNADVVLTDKWDRDTAFLAGDVRSYRYCSAYLTDREVEEFRQNSDLYDRIMTVSGNLKNTDVLFSYLDKDTLCQAVTHDLLAYSFSEDMELRSLETALGYSNVMLDMLRVTWPEEEEPGWEVYYETVSSNLGTYWKTFRYFDRVSISESDARVRNFLCMDFAQERQENVIRVDISPFAGSADFVLRTHYEDVAAVSGGRFELLEEGAWLIHADQSHLEIEMQTNEKYYF